MALEFSYRNQVEAQLWSIASQQIDKALRECDDDKIELGELVHKLRRRCKKLRGLVRMAKPHFKQWKRENRAFRDAARSLSGRRDAAVLGETFSDLLTFDSKRDGGGRIGEGQAARLGKRFADRVGEPPKGEDRIRFLKSFVKIFKAAAKRAKSWSLSGHGFDKIGDGVEETYQRMRDGLRQAEAQPTAELMHAWRKDTKYHWQHVGLLHRAAPEVLEPRKKALDQLGELLGDHHNLVVLTEALAKRRNVKTVRRVIRERQKLLAADALVLGRQLVAEKPALLRTRLEQYWALLPEKS
ncbi:MAG TPA: CHAD domain-containing protein [Devosia sp.]|jgi:hypothetical protein|nr:CHAD domain-containing protein [Devosia sp.]